ncbi:succinylglutamate desuccinylase/aspartoacylase family protein [Allohahella sp. A8]|uniref:succinylglutamate desuccinylase/aspartoacylase family protein n=1 Tax=Allohahella sp. A8 TaxID=3141461 RepID=UPI003A81129E
MQTETIPLWSPAPGTRRELLVYRFGSDASTGPVAYLQAGLHADEWPGLLVLQHLIPLLTKAEAEGRLKGRIILVPFANPVGMSQNIFGYVTGRFDLTGRGNFNRNFPTFNVGEFEIDALPDDLGPGFREFLKQSLQSRYPDNETDYLKQLLLGLALEADFVFDLHCDDYTAAHAYCADFQQAKAAEVAGILGFTHLFTEPLDGVIAFDGSALKPWYDLLAATGNTQLAAEMPLAMTLEYRGQIDVDDALAEDDAERLASVLQHCGVIAGVQPEPRFCEVEISPLQAVDTVYAPETGLLVFRRQLGERLKTGEHYADIVRIDQLPPHNRLALRARTDGVLMGLSHRRLVRPGDQIAKVAGTEALAHRRPGSLLQI